MRFTEWNGMECFTSVLVKSGGLVPLWLQELQQEKEEVEAEIQAIGQGIAKDLGLTLDKTLKLEWHKTYNTRSRCLRITSKEERIVRKKLQARWGPQHASAALSLHTCTQLPKCSGHRIYVFLGVFCGIF